MNHLPSIFSASFEQESDAESESGRLWWDKNNLCQKKTHAEDQEE